MRVLNIVGPDVAIKNLISSNALHLEICYIRGNMEVIVFPTTLKGPGSGLTDDFETFFFSSQRKYYREVQYIQQLKADSSG